MAGAEEGAAVATSPAARARVSRKGLAKAAAALSDIKDGGNKVGKAADGMGRVGAVRIGGAGEERRSGHCASIGPAFTAVPDPVMASAAAGAQLQIVRP